MFRHIIQFRGVSMSPIYHWINVRELKEPISLVHLELDFGWAWVDLSCLFVVKKWKIIQNILVEGSLGKIHLVGSLSEWHNVLTKAVLHGINNLRGISSFLEASFDDNIGIDWQLSYVPWFYKHCALMLGARIIHWCLEHHTLMLGARLS